MAANRPVLDAMMAEEGSRALHEEFVLAEGGALPTREERIARARAASSRAWLRHLARALGASWPEAPEGVSARLELGVRGDPERLEALGLEEAARAERRGASRDPGADRRDAELAARGRLFAEELARLVGDEGDAPGAGRRAGAWLDAHAGERRALEEEAREAWSRDPATFEPDAERPAEAAAVWAHTRQLAAAVEALLGEPAAGR